MVGLVTRSDGFTSGVSSWSESSDECTAIHVRAETKWVITALWPAIIPLCSASLHLIFFLGDWRKKPQTVWKKTSALTQRKLIQICYTEVKEFSWEFLLRKPLNIIVPNHQESKYDISYLIFFSRSPLQAGYIIKIFSLWNRFFSETRTLVNSLDTFFLHVIFMHFLFEMEALFL